MVSHNPQHIIAVDAMGGDNAPRVPVKGALRALDQNPSLRIAFYGEQALIMPLLKSAPADIQARLGIHHTTEVVSPNDKPSQMIRRGQNSSMNLAINAVKEDQAIACISAGNTGALMALSLFSLRCLKGISRPALGRAIPTIDGTSCILDLGANVQASARDLAEYAMMGAAFAECVLKRDRPRVALLNVGTEEIKGPPEIREADQILTESHLHYIGFVEGSDLISQKADVIVCDGFSGNLVLKTAEGVFRVFGQVLRRSLTNRFPAAVGALLVKPAIKSGFRHFDPMVNEGAILLGLRKTVIKAHGSTNAKGYANAIQIAFDMAQQKMNSAIESHLEAMQKQNLLADRQPD